MQDKNPVKKVKRLNFKDRKFWTTVQGRNIFRSMRQTLYKLGMYMPVPNNDVIYTHAYCEEWGNDSMEMFDEPPETD